MADIEASIRGSLSFLREAEDALASYGRAEARPANIVRLEMQSLLAIIRQCHYLILDLSESEKRLDMGLLPSVRRARRSSLSSRPDDVGP